MFFTIQERVRRGSEYRAARDRLQAEQASAAEAHAREEHDAAERRRFLAKVPEEPASGEAGNALLCFHVGGRKVWRRFESCSTLHDLINYVRSLPDVDPRAEVELTNVTTAPAVWECNTLKGWWGSQCDSPCRQCNVPPKRRRGAAL